MSHRSIKLNTALIKFYMTRAKAASPWVKGGYGIDVTFVGVVRGLLSYGFTFLEERVTSGRMQEGARLLQMAALRVDPHGAPPRPYRHIPMPEELWRRTSWREELPGASPTETLSALVELATSEMMQESDADQAGFWVYHFNAEAAAGLRRGRRSWAEKAEKPPV